MEEFSGSGEVSVGEASSESRALSDSDILEAQGLSERPSDDELMGLQPDVEEEQASSGPEKDADQEGDEDNDGDEQERELEQDEKTDGKTVPLPALHQARRENRALREQMQQQSQQIEWLSQQIANFQAQPPQQQPPQVQQQQPVSSFKELSAEQFKELMDNDPDAAMQYMYDRQDHAVNQLQQQFSKQFTEMQANAQREAQIAADNAVIESSYSQIDSMMPEGFYTNDDVRDEIEDFAITQLGMTEDAFALTDPATLIFPEGASQPMLAGQSAVELTRAIVAAYNIHKGSAGQVDAARKQAQADLARKFKSGESMTRTPMATDIPSAHGEVPQGEMSVAQALRKYGPDSKEFAEFMGGF